jgi:hypothetical protein
VVEGEKDADRLWSLEFAATCNAHGASEPDKGPKWKRKHREQLRRADIVVLNDNDRPAWPTRRQSANYLSASLRAFDASRWRDHWPDIGKRDDVSDWLDRGGGTPERLREPVNNATKIGGPPNPPQRPSIGLSAGETPRIVDEVQEALIASGLPIYSRGGTLVTPGWSKEPTWDKKLVNVQVISELRSDTVVELAELSAAFFKIAEREGEPTRVLSGLPKRIATTLLARGYALKFPTLRAIANTPSITVTGDLLDRPGYDQGTGVLYDPLDTAFPCIPDIPTASEITAALNRVLILLHTLDPDFEGPEDKDVALSTLMTPIVRRALDFAPFRGLDAPVAGSGKSPVFEIASILATATALSSSLKGRPMKNSKTARRIANARRRPDHHRQLQPPHRRPRPVPEHDAVSRLMPDTRKIRDAERAEHGDDRGHGQQPCSSRRYGSALDRWAARPEMRSSRNSTVRLRSHRLRSRKPGPARRRYPDPAQSLPQRRETELQDAASELRSLVEHGARLHLLVREPRRPLQDDGAGPGNRPCHGKSEARAGSVAGSFRRRAGHYFGGNRHCRGDASRAD